VSRAHAGSHRMKTATFLCPFCGSTVAIDLATWELVHAQILLHFSHCSPPDLLRDTAVVMEAAARIADALVNEEG
jgi:hypothetical protein